VTGFSERLWKVVQKIEPGDYFLCYLTGVSRWVGLLEVTSEPFFSEEPIWSSRVFPSRVRVHVILSVPPEHGVPVQAMREELTVFQGLKAPNRWQAPFRTSPTKWAAADGEAVTRALQRAKSD
jgi:hypothetical protein